jgi:hypothetical protein
MPSSCTPGASAEVDGGGACVEPAGQIVLGVEFQFGSRQVVRDH